MSPSPLTVPPFRVASPLKNRILESSPSRIVTGSIVAVSVTTRVPVPAIYPPRIVVPPVNSSCDIPSISMAAPPVAKSSTSESTTANSPLAVSFCTKNEFKMVQVRYVVSPENSKAPEIIVATSTVWSEVNVTEWEPARSETITNTVRYVIAYLPTKFDIELFRLTDDAHHAERFRRRCRQ